MSMVDFLKFLDFVYFWNIAKIKVKKYKFYQNINIWHIFGD